MYTRRGDEGETSLFGPRRVGKDSPRIEAYGSIDELNSLLGVIVAGCRDSKMSAELVSVQKMLFVAGGDLAADDPKADVPRITHHHTLMLEAMTDRMLKTLPPIRNFILPGGSRLASEIQLARAVCRRSERRIVEAGRSESINHELVPFFNRLSSYLFNLARLANKKAGRKETVWRRSS